MEGKLRPIMAEMTGVITISVLSSGFSKVGARRPLLSAIRRGYGVGQTAEAQAFGGNPARLLHSRAAFQHLQRGVGLLVGNRVGVVYQRQESPSPASTPAMPPAG